MIYLFGSIVLTSWLTLSFKVIEKFGINNLQAIVFNYITCVITGSIVNAGIPFNENMFSEPWLPWAVSMGIIFFLLFNLMGATAQRLGVSISTVSNKLSLVIPFLFSIYIYHEVNTVLKTIGIVLALLAVGLTCHQKEKKASPGSTPFFIWILPVALFFGSGILDTMIKYVEKSFLNDSNQNDYLVTAFTMAALVGIIFLAIQLFQKKQQLSWKAAIAGVGIGIFNYFSIWCLLKVLKDYGMNSSAIIPINNMGIVLFSAVVAFLLFREKLSMLNWSGIILALAAIALIAFG